MGDNECSASRAGFVWSSVRLVKNQVRTLTESLPQKKSPKWLFPDIPGRDRPPSQSLPKQFWTVRSARLSKCTPWATGRHTQQPELDRQVEESRVTAGMECRPLAAIPEQLKRKGLALKLPLGCILLKFFHLMQTLFNSYFILVSFRKSFEKYL